MLGLMGIGVGASPWAAPGRNRPRHDRRHDHDCTAASSGHNAGRLGRRGRQALRHRFPAPAGGRIPDHARTGRPLLGALPRGVPRPRQRSRRAPRAQESEGPHRDAAGPLGRGHDERPGHARRDSSERPRQVLQIARRTQELAAEIARIVKRLGADRCAEDPFAPADPERGLSEPWTRTGSWSCSSTRRDRTTTRSRRARLAPGQPPAAPASSPSTSPETARSPSLAAAFEIRDAPALLVVKQGFRVAVQIGGYADRETVAQAAANARG